MYRDSYLINKIKKALPIPVFESVELPMSIIDGKGIIVTANNSFFQLTGFERENIIGGKLGQFYAEDDRKIMDDYHNEFIVEGNYNKRESYIICPCGKKLHTIETSIKFIDEDLRQYRLISYIDKTNIKTGDFVKSVLFKISQIVNSNDSIENIIQNIHLAISDLIPSDNFLLACLMERNEINIKYNSYAKHLENVDDYNASMHKFIEFLIYNDEKSIISNNQITELINSQKIPLGEKIPQVILSTVLRTSRGNKGVLLLQNYTDPDAYDENTKQIMDFIAAQLSLVLERKIYETELLDSKLKAEEADRTKAAFLSQMSHEIRTPLNSIMSFSALIRSELNIHLNEELKDCFDMIERGGRRLIRTFDLILSAAGVQKGEYVPEFTEINIVEDIIRPLISRFYDKAFDKGLDILLIDNSDKCRITADYSSINQLFINLIDNAIKYTNKGRVEVKVFENENSHLQVDVSDTGIGISEEFLPNLFKYFSQEELGYTRSYDGNGLGLAIVKEFALLNKIAVKVSSKKGQGTTFSVIF